ncbi:hypothetical protein M422DRAFT_29269 [Sphaerobolus stellatus SS14]|nr:hypothetical protein M422DRAFT_29269 [Sphaerobolus stellatus SS14]
MDVEKPAYPPLPQLQGDLMLEVFTHKSLRAVEQAQASGSGFPCDNERYVVLGEKVFETAVLHHLVAQKVKMTREEIEKEMRSLCSEEQYEKWVESYGLRQKLRYNPSARAEVQSPAGGRELLHAYAGAVYTQLNGAVAVDIWVHQLISRPGDTLPHNLQLVEHQNYNQYQFPPHIPSPTTYIHTLPNAPGMNPNNNPQAPIIGQSPLLSGANAKTSTMNYAARLNELGSKRRWTVDWPFMRTGLDHAPIWRVQCVVNGKSYSTGSGTTKQLAKDEAARLSFPALGLFLPGEQTQL